MFGSVLSQVTGLADRRFLLTTFFPVLVFTLSAALLVVSSVGGAAVWVARWEALTGSSQVIVASGALAGIFVVATLFSANSLLITRLFEGHLGSKWLGQLGKERQGVRKRKATGDVELRFPHGDLMPTALGNVLRAAEEYPQRAYGVDALVAWPRLFFLLPDSLVTSASSALDTVQFLLLTSLLSATLAVAGGLFAAAVGLGEKIYLAIVLGGIVLARLTYRGAVEAAIDYGLHIRSAFDLYRNELLDRLNRAVPVTMDEEHRVWDDVSERLRRGEKRPVCYSLRAMK